MTAGQVSDYIGARALLSSLPKIEWLLGDRGHDAWLVQRSVERQGDTRCYPGSEAAQEARKMRQAPLSGHCWAMRCRSVIGIMFGRLKDWRPVATRYDRCPKVFLSAIALAAIAIYWL